ncbi:unnamed protein product [Trichogramma brassicae]|uniref:Uncharacterized protein n=1 Tax=Trichogramma brassicae TaxID=86971 RepID=A0A6H5J3V6_9HYME|nr:unnamed protein product [Trichogramma brassicae]
MNKYPFNLDFYTLFLFCAVLAFASAAAKPGLLAAAPLAAAPLAAAPYYSTYSAPAALSYGYQSYGYPTAYAAYPSYGAYGFYDRSIHPY